MHAMKHRLPILAALLLCGSAAATSSDVSSHQRIDVQLVSEVASIQPGEPFRLALRMEPDQHWHTYWKNPGDSGIETRLSWTLPNGFEAGTIDWPWPERLPVGPLVNYGYSGIHGLPVAITPPEDLQPGTEATLNVHAEWLVCKVECIPGEADLRLDLPVRSGAPAKARDQAALFDWIDARQPAARDWPARFSTAGDRFSLSVDVPADYPTDDLAMFPAAPELVDHAAEASFAADSGRLLVSQPLSDYFTGAPESVQVVLVNTVRESAVALTARPGELGSAAPVAAGSAATGSAPPGEPAMGTAAALLLALAGGVLLNLMPCVFPVLSLKALSVVEGGERQRAHGIVYTLGVLVAFAAVAGLLLGLRAAGAAVGWGFQLQSAWFVALLAYLLFALALSLSGLVQFGTGLMGAGDGLARRGGLAGSFFTGVLACVVASPCTAPFMGAALGFAVTQPAPLALAVFLALGLGLALPMLVLGFIPGLGRLLPRPGPWMETFKQAMAFPLYLTVAWLTWVLARQAGADALGALLAGLVALAFALWLLGRRTRSAWGTSLRHAASALILLGVLVTPGWIAGGSGTAGGDQPADAAWEPWSPERLAALRAEGRPVFVNMTADWCVTCLVNERVALDTERVRQHMEDNGIVYLKGDWTRRDPAITRYLARFDRNGVPLYVYYDDAADAEPRVLPQVLTPGLVTEALQ